MGVYRGMSRYWNKYGTWTNLGYCFLSIFIETIQCTKHSNWTLVNFEVWSNPLRQNICFVCASWVRPPENFQPSGNFRTVLKIFCEICHYVHKTHTMSASNTKFSWPGWHTSHNRALPFTFTMITPAWEEGGQLYSKVNIKLV